MPLERRAAADGSFVVAVCAAIEAEIAQLEEGERSEFLAELGLEEPGLNRVIRAAYRLLGLETYFTVGPEGSAGLDGACRCHGTAGGGRDPYGFRARLHPRRGHCLRRLLGGQGRSGARDAGKLRLEGKEYVVQEGDVMHFRFNV